MIVRSNRKLEVCEKIEIFFAVIFELISFSLKITKKGGKAKFLLFENSFKVDNSENATKKSSEYYKECSEVWQSQEKECSVWNLTGTAIRVSIQ